jgi:hypothetical protein
MKLADLFLIGLLGTISVPSASLAQSKSSLSPISQTSYEGLFQRDWAFGGETEMVRRLRPCGSQLCGTIVALGEHVEGAVEERDVRNPGPALRNRAVCGLQILSGFERTPNGWSQGSARSDPACETYGKGESFLEGLSPVPLPPRGKPNPSKP